MAVIFVFSSIPGDEFPQYEGLWDILVKKSGHLLAYGLLAVAFWRALMYGRNNSGQPTIGAVLASLALTVLYAATDEFHQLFTPGREGTPADVGIDAAGACLGLAAYFALAAIRQTRSRTARSPASRPPA